MTEWHEWRRHGIGGSDIPSLLGLNSFGTPFTVWCDKHNLLPPTEETERQSVGKWLEKALAERFEQTTGHKVTSTQEWCVMETHPWRRCTIDGRVSDAIWECKTDARPGKLHDADNVPPSMKAQSIWNAGINQAPGTWLTVFKGLSEPEHIWIPFDAEDFAFMCDVADRFWHDHVLTMSPPDCTGLSTETDALRSIFPGTPGKVVEIDPEIHVRWSEARDARLAAEKEEAAAANELRLALGDAEIGTVAGIVVVTNKATAVEHIDPRAERMPKPRKPTVAIPERAQRFYNPEPTRTLRDIKNQETAA